MSINLPSKIPDWPWKDDHATEIREQISLQTVGKPLYSSLATLTQKPYEWPLPLIATKPESDSRP